MKTVIRRSEATEFATKTDASNFADQQCEFYPIDWNINVTKTSEYCFILVVTDENDCRVGFVATN